MKGMVVRMEEKITLKTKGAITHIFIDGKEIHNVKAVEFKHDGANGLPTLILNLFVPNLEIDAEDITTEYINN